MHEHPEQKCDEIYLGNANDQDFATIGWNTKRKGNVAYNKNGEKLEIPGYFPVFVTRQEVYAEWKMKKGRGADALKELMDTANIFEL